jgi:hypothetical protein
VRQVLRDHRFIWFTTALIKRINCVLSEVLSVLGVLNLDLFGPFLHLDELNSEGWLGTRPGVWGVRHEPYQRRLVAAALVGWSLHYR